MTRYALKRLTAIGVGVHSALRIAQSLVLTSQVADTYIGSMDRAPNAWNFIVTGIAAAGVVMEKGDYAVQDIFGPETWIGENQILNPGATNVRYICLTDVELLQLPTSEFWQLIEAEPAFVKHLTRLIAWRAQRATEMLSLIKSGNPSLRSVMGLGMFFEALAAKSDHPITDAMEDSISIPVKQELIAQLCGVSRTSLWESMSRLEANGWLKIHYGKLELLHLPTWRTVVRRWRERESAKVNPTLDELLLEFKTADRGFCCDSGAEAKRVTGSAC